MPPQRIVPFARHFAPTTWRTLAPLSVAGAGTAFALRRAVTLRTAFRFLLPATLLTLTSVGLGGSRERPRPPRATLGAAGAMVQEIHRTCFPLYHAFGRSRGLESDAIFQEWRNLLSDVLSDGPTMASLLADFGADRRVHTRRGAPPDLDLPGIRSDWTKHLSPEAKSWMDPELSESPDADPDDAEGARGKTFQRSAMNRLTRDNRDELNEFGKFVQTFEQQRQKSDGQAPVITTEPPPKPKKQSFSTEWFDPSKEEQ